MAATPTPAFLSASASSNRPTTAPTAATTAAQAPAFNSALAAAIAAKKSKPPPPAPKAKPKPLSIAAKPNAEMVTALYDYSAQAEGDLTFKAGDAIEIITRSQNPNEWWTGRVGGREGQFPGNYVQLAQ